MTPSETAGRIGPNAITRVEEALTLRFGAGVCRDLFARAGLLRHLEHRPEEMVDEADVAHLHGALHACLPEADAGEVAAEAGRLTGDYLLARRIPRAAQWLLRLLPRPLAAQLFTQAIARHAWTFAGSGEFSAAREAGGLILSIRHNPAVREVEAERPSCQYFAATFERLFTAVLGPGVRVVETGCEAAGNDACSFRVSWGASRRV
jgi:divinyl protochlorophyllide a 8-vinyl-reductase